MHLLQESKHRAIQIVRFPGASQILRVSLTEQRKHAFVEIT
jgi:hypothetical protein